MYKSSKIAEDMVWRHKGRIKDDVLRHPADTKAWKDFDAQYPEFTADPRDIRLVLTSDGFNLFRVMILRTAHDRYS